MLHTGHPTRRGVLGLAAAGAAIVLAPVPASATLSAAAQAAVDRVRNNRTPQEGRIVLRAPPIAENGNTVPITISVESPMTAADHVTRIHVFADKNPTPDVATFHLTPACGRAQVDTRIRLSQTQDVIVLAEMSDGSLYMTRAEVKVTIGGCGG
ncbi:thiosulfate oxidation carrier protein SoxY [Elioraea tepida]|uniref:Thiosulfate oxidation carrier protein SoxY n=1 Tax=Elioraea tepida TaxID=2843330 RepID=A0A975U2F1_9PROT|nr:thiosulfate oxidation carrier protein SoxY [Elioraea tepida]QXM24409.1 thiosulfate oxidation carrier protein SoxY [Elioraea tepida]